MLLLLPMANEFSQRRGADFSRVGWCHCSSWAGLGTNCMRFSTRQVFKPNDKMKMVK